MSERWADTFRFEGRLSRGGSFRLERRHLVIALVGWVVPLLLIIAGAPRPLALIPIILLPASGLAFLAAHVRRLHDVGRHARGEIVRALLVITVVAGPASAAVFVPDLPQELIWALVGISGTAFVVGAISSGFRGNPTWKAGDEGRNEFGPPPIP